MARFLGIDISKDRVRAALVRTSYRRVAIEALLEAPIPEDGSATKALADLLGRAKVDAVGVALPGDRCFYRRVELPATAQKEMDSVLAFELESSIPFELEGAVFDHRLLRARPAEPGAEEQLVVFAAIAKIEDVQERIDLVKDALGREPDTVEPGSITLANLVSLVPELLSNEKTPEGEPVPTAILDLGETRSELLLLERGEPCFARTISRGTQGLPKSAEDIARELKQSFLAWRAAGGATPTKLHLIGQGAAAQGAETFLEAMLGVPVHKLTAIRAEGIKPEDQERVPAFARAIAIAMANEGKSRSLNLRQGPLEVARSYAFLREKAPLLTGLSLVLLVSFGFSLVAEMRALGSEHEVLEQELKATTKEVFGEETTDMARANELLEKGPAGEDDPFPHADAFDVMVELGKAVPKDVVHDVAEFDVARGHAVIQGLVPDGTDAQATADRIASSFKQNPCMRDVKVSKVTQFGAEKQKYILEMDVRCEDKKKKTDSSKAEPKTEEGEK